MYVNIDDGAKTHDRMVSNDAIVYLKNYGNGPNDSIRIAIQGGHVVIGRCVVDADHSYRYDMLARIDVSGPLVDMDDDNYG